MVNKTIRIVLVFSLILSTTACYSTKIFLPGEMAVKEREPIDYVVLKDKGRVNLENGFLKDGDVYGDVIRKITLGEITEAYNKNGKIITSTALQFQSQRSNFKQYLKQINRVKLSNGETINILEIMDFKDGILTVMTETGSLLFTRDEIFSTPAEQRRLDITSITLKDGRQITVNNGFIMNGKVYESKIASMKIPLGNIAEAKDKSGNYVSGEAIIERAEKKDFIKYASKLATITLNTGEVFDLVNVNDLKDNECFVQVELKTEVASVNDISFAKKEEGDTGKSILAGVGILGIIMLTGIIIIAATKESCPFIYSYNGEKYVFDGEPCGGAICKALKRTDLSKLEYLVSEDGVYRLILTNQVNECQFTDQLKLLVVDHPAGTEIIQDEINNLYTISSRIKPVKVTDGKGMDLRSIFAEKDNRLWQSDLKKKDPERREDLRDDIYLVFPKPEKACSAKLIVLGGTTLWGSYMLKLISELHGKNIRKWHESFNNPVNLLMLNQWINRTGTYRLGVAVKTSGGWQQRGTIFGGGPLIYEERILTIDVSDISGKELEIKISPPAGFWQFDSLFVDYSDETPIEVREISADSIYDDTGADITYILDYIDDDYCIMPFKGQKALLTFAAPETTVDMKRTIFAKTNGFYYIYFDDSTEPKNDILGKIRSDADFFIRYSIQKYHETKN